MKWIKFYFLVRNEDFIFIIPSSEEYGTTLCLREQYNGEKRRQAQEVDYPTRKQLYNTHYSIKY